jgi:hypothetical protein
MQDEDVGKEPGGALANPIRVAGPTRDRFHDVRPGPGAV